MCVNNLLSFQDKVKAVAKKAPKSAEVLLFVFITQSTHFSLAPMKLLKKFTN